MINIAQYGLLSILSLFLILHFCIILKIIPYNLVWGGRLKTDREMYRFEAISIGINLIFIFIILIQAHFWAIDFPNRIMAILLWGMTALFLLNTFGNAISKNKVEQVLFTPLTILLTLFSLILAISN